jgi:hypothetical protein
MKRLELDELKVESPTLLATLRRAPEIVQPRQLPQYYPKLIELAKDRDAGLRRAAISALSETIALNVKNAQAFATGGHLSSLPITPDSLPLYRTVALYIPDALTPVSASLARAIPHHPRELLFIIALYAKAVRDIDDPSRILKLLLTHSDSFRALPLEYVSLLGFLADDLADFAVDSGAESCRAISALLDSKEDGILRACYCALARFAGSLKSIDDLPLDLLADHLSNPYLYRSVTSLFLRLESPPVSQAIVDSLLELAEADMRATVILLKLGGELRHAKLIVKNQDWMARKLPNEVDTLRLFGTVLAHPQLKAPIAANAGLVPFLAMLLKAPDAACLAPLGTLLRRISFSAATVKKLSRSGFLRDYFAMGIAHDDQELVQGALVFATIIAGVAYTPELKDVAAAIADLIETDTMVPVAIQAATRLVENEDCAADLEEANLPSLLAKKKRDPAVKALGGALVAALKAAAAR